MEIRENVIEKKVKKQKLPPRTSLIGVSDCTVEDFWAWAYSDILSNRNRAIFAEFLVAWALEETTAPRIEWDAVDIHHRGKFIEVKSAAYLQSWKQEKLSAIRFDIAPKRGWDEKSNTSTDVPVRSADCYVFCLYSETNPKTATVLNIADWEFYVIKTATLNKLFPNQKSISLNRLKKLCDPVKYENLKQTIETILEI